MSYHCMTMTRCEFKQENLWELMGYLACHVYLPTPNMYTVEHIYFLYVCIYGVCVFMHVVAHMLYMEARVQLTC